MATEFTTPVGRLVWGHPIRQTQKRDMNTNKPLLKPDGTPDMQYAFGVAFDKQLFTNHIWPEMHKEALTGYPGGQFPANFSWKYKDGDNPGVDNTGKPISVKDGHAGCFVLTVTSSLPNPPGVFKLENGQYRQLTEKEIKCGDFVALGLEFQVNVPQNRTHTPSLYVNPRAVELVGYGSEIASGGTVDPTAVFGGRQHALPPGASAMPVGGAGMAQMPGMGQQPPMGAPPQGMPQQSFQPAPGGYAPQPGGSITSGMPPMGAPPHQYQQPYPGQPAPQGMPQPGPGQYAPAPDFVHNAGQQPYPGQPAPQGMPGQPMQQPGQMPGGYPPR